MYQPKSFISSTDLLYQGILHEVGRSSNPLQPIYEAFTNSLESIILREHNLTPGEILIKITSSRTTDEQTLYFNKIEIEDNGIGFNPENFKRLLTYKDDRKGFKNRGSGRIQFIHFFNKALFESTYRNESNFEKVSFILSKSSDFISRNAIVYFIGKESVSEAQDTFTRLTLQELLPSKWKKTYNELTPEILKKAIVARYMMYFCAHRNELPKIKIEHYMDHEKLTETSISEIDVPQVDNQQKFTVNYSSIAGDAKTVFQDPTKFEEFEIKAFKIPKGQLEKNAIKFTSKGEIVEQPEVPLTVLSPEDHIENCRYLFLLSSNYIDEKDSNVRGKLRIADLEKFKEQGDLFGEEEILLDDIKTASNSRAAIMYSEIQKIQKEQSAHLEKLKSMFLFNEETISNLSIALNDSEDKILEKVYAAEAKNVAKQDVQMKKRIEELEQLNPASNDYQAELAQRVRDLVKQTSIQNRTTLTHYVARRKLVLELFNKILNKGLTIQDPKNPNIDEKLLHNLIFQQSSESPENSDLWLVNEDFIYFNGISESKLGDIKINGEKVFKAQLNEEENAHRKSQGEDRYSKRTDVLLFPEENKCILIEFKNPNVNLSEHLNQIQRYASLIRNFSEDKYQFDTFYGYLIGENMNPEDVLDFDSDFKISYQFKYVFRPAKPIIGKFGKSNGSLYMEVLKYSTLLDRAKKRNEIFLKKLGYESIGTNPKD